MTAQINQEELFSFYAAIGEAIWLLQALEDVLAKYVTMKHDISTPGSVSEKEAEELLRKNKKGTLGTLLNVVFKNHVMPIKLENRFRDFKNERDWLVHRCSHENVKDLYSSEKRKKLILRIKKFNDESIILRALTFQDLEQFFLEKGLNTKLAESIAMNELDKLKNQA